MLALMRRWRPEPTHSQAMGRLRSWAACTNASAFWRRSGPGASRPHRTCRDNSGGSRSSASWAAAGLESSSWRWIRSCDGRSRSRCPVPKCWSAEDPPSVPSRGGSGLPPRPPAHRARLRGGEEGPVSYIASAYCEGPTLADWLRGQTEPVPCVEAARLVAILAAAVAHAHQRGSSTATSSRATSCSSPASHPSRGARRDRQALGYLPRICDFGLAKLLDEVSQETGSGVPIGSASLHGARTGRRPDPRAGPGHRRLCAGGDPLRAA